MYTKYPVISSIHPIPASDIFTEPCIVSAYFQGSVMAGFPSPAEDDREIKLDIAEHLVPHPVSTFFFRMGGREMEGAGIFSGDLLVVDRSLSARSGSIVVVVVGGELLVRKLIVHPHKVTSIAEGAREVQEATLAEGDEIWGVVTYTIHKPVRSLF